MRAKPRLVQLLAASSERSRHHRGRRRRWRWFCGRDCCGAVGGAVLRVQTHCRAAATAVQAAGGAGVGLRRRRLRQRRLLLLCSCRHLPGFLEHYVRALGALPRLCGNLEDITIGPSQGTQLQYALVRTQLNALVVLPDTLPRSYVFCLQIRTFVPPRVPPLETSVAATDATIKAQGPPCGPS